jgi:hypothetical protein
MEGGHTLQTLAHPPTPKEETKIVGGFSAESIGDLTSEAVPKLAQSFKEVPGVESVAFNLELQVASVEFEPQQCSVDTLQRAVLKARYRLL